MRWIGLAACLLLACSDVGAPAKKNDATPIAERAGSDRVAGLAAAMPAPGAQAGAGAEPPSKSEATVVWSTAFEQAGQSTPGVGFEGDPTQLAPWLIANQGPQYDPACAARVELGRAAYNTLSQVVFEVPLASDMQCLLTPPTAGCPGSFRIEWYGRLASLDDVRPITSIEIPYPSCTDGALAEHSPTALRLTVDTLLRRDLPLGSDTLNFNERLELLGE